MIDSVADDYEYAEKRLWEWGRACHQAEKALGRALAGGLADTIGQVQAETRRENRAKQEIRTALRKARKAWKEGDPPIDSQLVAEALGYTDPKLTAQGKDTRSTKLAKIALDTRIMVIDRIVANLQGWQRKCIWRSFYYGQRDSKAANELRMRREEYSSRKRAAVQVVADKLDRRSDRATPPPRQTATVQGMPKRPILSLKHRSG